MTQTKHSESAAQQVMQRRSPLSGRSRLHLETDTAFWAEMKEHIGRPLSDSPTDHCYRLRWRQIRNELRAEYGEMTPGQLNARTDRRFWKELESRVGHQLSSTDPSDSPYRQRWIEIRNRLRHDKGQRQETASASDDSLAKEVIDRYLPSEESEVIVPLLSPDTIGSTARTLADSIAMSHLGELSTQAEGWVAEKAGEVSDHFPKTTESIGYLSKLGKLDSVKTWVQRIGKVAGYLSPVIFEAGAAFEKFLKPFATHLTFFSGITSLLGVAATLLGRADPEKQRKEVEDEQQVRETLSDVPYLSSYLDYVGPRMKLLAEVATGLGAFASMAAVALPMIAPLLGGIAVGLKIASVALNPFKILIPAVKTWIYLKQKSLAIWGGVTGAANWVANTAVAGASTIWGGMKSAGSWLKGKATKAVDATVAGARGVASGIGVAGRWGWDELKYKADTLKTGIKQSRNVLDLAWTGIYSMLSIHAPGDGDLTGPFLPGDPLPMTEKDISEKYPYDFAERDDSIGSGAVVFVNGQVTSLLAHYQAAQGLANTTGRSVVGVYNASAVALGVVGDTLQSGGDKLALNRQMNPATRTLVSLIRRHGDAKGGKKGDTRSGALKFVAHSQGSILIEEARRIARFDENVNIERHDISTFGNAIMTQSEMGAYRHFAYEGDPVTRLVGSLPLLGAERRDLNDAIFQSMTQIPLSLPMLSAMLTPGSVPIGMGKPRYLSNPSRHGNIAPDPTIYGPHPLQVDQEEGKDTQGMFIIREQHGRSGITTPGFGQHSLYNGGTETETYLPSYLTATSRILQSGWMEHDLKNQLDDPKLIENRIRQRIGRSTVQRSGGSGAADFELASRLDPALLRATLLQQDSGSPVGADVRGHLESVSGVDASRARLHTGGASAQAATALNAEAFTIGNDIFFGSGMYSPQTAQGRGLLAHELTHVGQQTGARNGGGPQMFSASGGDAMEQEAQQVGQRASLDLAQGNSRGGLEIGSFAVTYDVEDTDLSPEDQARLANISKTALNSAKAQLMLAGLPNADLDTVDVQVEIDLAIMTDEEASEAWATALVEAISTRVPQNSDQVSTLAGSQVQRSGILANLVELSYYAVTRPVDTWRAVKDVWANRTEDSEESELVDEDTLNRRLEFYARTAPIRGVGAGQKIQDQVLVPALQHFDDPSTRSSETTKLDKATAGWMQNNFGLQRNRPTSTPKDTPRTLQALLISLGLLQGDMMQSRQPAPGVIPVADSSQTMPAASMPTQTSSTNRPRAGILTFEAEGQANEFYKRKGKQVRNTFFSRRLHWPGGASGVTIGRGYDMKLRTAADVEKDLIAAGVPEETAKKYAQGAGKSGTTADIFVKANKTLLDAIPVEAEVKLFEGISSEYRNRAIKQTKKNGVDLKQCAPVLQDLIFDMAYRGNDYTSNHALIDPFLIANDVAGLLERMQTSEVKNVEGKPKKVYTYFKKVPEDRQVRRIEFLKAGLGSNQPTVTQSTPP